MSGHSKWSTIKRKKAATDAKRGKLFTQLIREITVSARQGGSDPLGNPRLRLAMDKARSLNMPKDNIERAIRKGSGAEGGEQYEEIRYEGYGPGGVAVIVDTLTDNRNRTVGEIRHLFSKHGGNLGSNGCVAYLFEQTGVLEFDRDGVDAERLMEAAIDADASDVEEEGEVIRALTRPDAFESVKQRLEQGGFAAALAEVQMLPQSSVALTGRDAQTMVKLFEAIDDHEDVKQVYANFDISDQELLAAAS